MQRAGAGQCSETATVCRRRAPAISRHVRVLEGAGLVVRERDGRLHRMEIAGGRYRFELKHSGGNLHIVGGVFEEVTRPTRLAYTFKWEHNPDFGESRVTVQLEKTTMGTKLVLI